MSDYDCLHVPVTKELCQAAHIILVVQSTFSSQAAVDYLFLGLQVSVKGYWNPRDTNHYWEHSIGIYSIVESIEQVQ